MPEPTIPRRDFHQDRQAGVADMLTDLDPSFDTVRDFSICEGRTPRVQEPELRHDRAPLAELAGEPESQEPLDDSLSSSHPQGTPQSRQAAGVAVHVSLERHGWKKTGKSSSLWAFEHRWPHLRDRAEGRNHRP
jgi:hypothetical protein